MSRLNFALIIWRFTKPFSSSEQLSGPKRGTMELLLLTEFNVLLTANKNEILFLGEHKGLFCNFFKFVSKRPKKLVLEIFQFTESKFDEIEIKIENKKKKFPKGAF